MDARHCSLLTSQGGLRLHVGHYIQEPGTERGEYEPRVAVASKHESQPLILWLEAELSWPGHGGPRVLEVWRGLRTSLDLFVFWCSSCGGGDTW